MQFRVSFCDPFKPDSIELGDIEKEKIIDYFKKIPWKKMLEEMSERDESEIFYSPSLEIENKGNRNGLSISIVDDNEWYIFFKRPKVVKKFFGLIEKIDDDYLTDVTGQTEQDAVDCLSALLNNDLQFLVRKIK